MIKHTAYLYGLKPEMVLADNIIRSVYTKYGHGCVITCGLDSHVGKLSFHNLGWGLDYRTKTVKPEIMKQIVEECKLALPQYDLAFEDIGGNNEHLHCEFDPKNDPTFRESKREWKRTGRWPS